ncbi:MAG TPA: CHAD domain-containing protein [Opitutaceae bacterium]|jgi:hypothetical protein
MAYSLEPGEPVDAGLARITREQVHAAASGAVRASEPVGLRVHKARTTCKKIRAVLRLYAPLGRGDVSGALDFYRTVDDPLSRPRDAEILLVTFDGVVRRWPRRYSRLRAALLVQQRDLAGSERSAEVALRAFANAIRRAGQAPEPSLVPAGIEGIADGLKEAYSKGLKAFRRAAERRKPSDYHNWRKASKVIGYHHRLLHKMWPPFLASLRHQWDELSDLLGAEHDLTVLIDHLDDYAGSGDEVEAALDVARKAGKLRQAARRAAEKLGGSLFGEKPRRWLRRIVSEWNASLDAPRQAGS